jgi:hypothetical protein
MLTRVYTVIGTALEATDEQKRSQRFSFNERFC